MNRNYEFHPLSSTFPLTDGPELDVLADDIRQHGLQQDITLYEGKILDGRRRYLACQKAGVTPRFLGLAEGMSPLDFVVSANIQRRHLSRSQLAVIGLKLLPLYEAQAKERQRLSKGRGQKGATTGAAFCGKAADHAAKIVGCSGGMIERAKRVQVDAPLLLPKIERGELSVSDAYALAREKDGKAAVSTSTKQFALRIATIPDDFTPEVRLMHGDALEQLRLLSEKSVHSCVTSVPFYLLRDYEEEGQIGLEKSVEEWVDKLVAVFAEVRRVLRDDGTAWVNVGDTYGHSTNPFGNKLRTSRWTPQISAARKRMNKSRPVHPKSLLFAPHRLIIALAESGWIGRAEIIVEKNSTDSCRSRPVRTHEYVFLLAKTDRYYYDADFLREPYSMLPSSAACDSSSEHHPAGKLGTSLWRLILPGSAAGGHPAPMHIDLAEKCVIGGCPEGGTVLDPFVGSGTTAAACVENRRHCVGIDLSEKYLRIAEQRVPGARIVRPDVA
jgi:DNA modification methylase